jgi:UDP-glucose 6-dehydrogenase
LPKDVEAIASFIRKNNIRPNLIQAALDVNRQVKVLTSAKVSTVLPPL